MSAEGTVAERREQAAAEAVLTRIGQTVMLRHAGDREEARRRFLALWTELGEDGDPLHRCTLAHYLAGAQDDPVDELAWDLRALTAAGELMDTPLADEADTRAVRALCPSLHLSLAADYLALGDRAAARSHLRRARLAAERLADDGRPGPGPGDGNGGCGDGSPDDGSRAGDGRSSDGRGGRGAAGDGRRGGRRDGYDYGVRAAIGRLERRLGEGRGDWPGEGPEEEPGEGGPEGGSGSPPGDGSVGPRPPGPQPSPPGPPPSPGPSTSPGRSPSSGPQPPSGPPRFPGPSPQPP